MKIKVESTSNSIYKLLKRLQTRNGREKSGCFFAEGLRSVKDLAKNGADINSIVVCEGTSLDENFDKFKVYEFSKTLFDELKMTVNSQGVIAIVNYSPKDASEINTDEKQTIVYLDSVQDPGNMGTIIRSCASLGADALILSKGCVDIYNPKVVRSAMASIPNADIYFDSDSEKTLTHLASKGFKITGTFPKNAVPCFSADFSDKTVIVMGNEANGISEKTESLCTDRITIPMSEKSESLNVATALTVVLYEIMRTKMVNRGDT